MVSFHLFLKLFSISLQLDNTAFQIRAKTEELVSQKRMATDASVWVLMKAMTAKVSFRQPRKDCNSVYRSVSFFFFLGMICKPRACFKPDGIILFLPYLFKSKTTKFYS